MKVTAVVPTEQVTDVRCDVCGASTRSVTGDLEYGVLQAHWEYGSTQHDGERYEVSRSWRSIRIRQRRILHRHL